MYELRIKNDYDTTEKAVPLKGTKVEAINEAHINYAPGLKFGGRVVDRESGETVHTFPPFRPGKKAPTELEVLRGENESLKTRLAESEAASERHQKARVEHAARILELEAKLIQMGHPNERDETGALRL